MAFATPPAVTLHCAPPAPSTRGNSPLRACWKRYRPLQYLLEGKHPGHPIAATSIQRAFRAACRKTGITKPVTPRSLRHAFATHLRDRHCPRCGGLDQRLWAEAELQHLLPVSYFHVVFTVPVSLRLFFTGAGRGKALDALFAAVSESILETAATRGLRPGVLAVLHTWTNNKVTIRTFTVSSQVAA